MKILEFAEARTIRLVECPEPEPKPGEVLVHTAVSVLCGSEMAAYRKGASPGSNSGHEAAGTVVAVGSGVDSSWISRRVGAGAISGCNACAYCRQGIFTACAQKVFHGSMHAELFTVAAASCTPLPEGMPWETGALVSGDGMGVPYHTHARVHHPETVHTVAIFGLGPIGLGSVLVQNYLGRTVIGVDSSPDRVALAKEMGAALVLQADHEDPVAAIRRKTGGEGADICIEAAGVPATAKNCLAAVRYGGQVLLNGEQSEIAISPSEDLIRRDITLTGCWFYHFNEVPAMLEWVYSGFAPDRMLTHRFPAARAADAYALFDQAKTGKIALLWESDTSG